MVCNQHLLRMAAAVITPFKCEKCQGDFQRSSGPRPRYCEDCSKELQVCEFCGDPVELKRWGSGTGSQLSAL